MNIRLRTLFVADDPPTGLFDELSVVRTKVDLLEGRTFVPKGSTGTIVHIYKGKEAYEVEFTEPQAVIGVHANELEDV